jgi:hypothetical protein
MTNDSTSSLELAISFYLNDILMRLNMIQRKGAKEEIFYLEQTD